ncbi:MAG TPA: fluoride efflux transporter CrcB [Bdellovibrionota bacterium]|nr:fluoride efflux transporter CrcB [Bdellovibrionota bacterium]
MEKALWAGVGGFIGSAARYVMGGYIARLTQNLPFPVETLVINVVGCSLLGFLAGLAEFRGMFSAEARVFLFIGILGGFTTFSTFGYETVQLVRDGQQGWGWMNIALQIVLGIGSTWIGLTFSRMV